MKKKIRTLIYVGLLNRLGPQAHKPVTSVLSGLISSPKPLSILECRKIEFLEPKR
ncbi:hypothetical protein HanRHA438_Chr07g0298151 [Helianthus annuus]|nr:hypothetical protein HanRHA438_Chr07g0298151 [Helianthus annuus]